MGKAGLASLSALLNPQLTSAHSFSSLNIWDRLSQRSGVQCGHAAPFQEKFSISSQDHTCRVK